MNHEAATTDLRPAKLIAELARLTHDEVEIAYPGVQVLLVELRPDTPDLATGLDENQGWAGAPPKPAAVAVPATVTFPALRATGSRHNLEGMDRIQLLAKLSGAPHFMLPLFKRQSPGSTPSEETKLTVGRVHGTDVMLSHSSVSKLHAWFEVDPSGALYVTDAKSLNGTRVNNKPLKPGEPQWIQPMDHLQFGSISAFTCAPLVLRNVVKSLANEGRAGSTLETP